MFEFILILFVVILVVAICLHHNTMKQKLADKTVYDAITVRKASDNSLNASNTQSPILALIDCAKAVGFLETLTDGRYTQDELKDLFKTDIMEAKCIIEDQLDRIKSSVISERPEWYPSHPLAESSGFTAPATDTSTTSKSQEVTNHRHKRKRAD